MRNFWKIFTTAFLFSFTCHAATIDSISQTTAIDFGKIANGCGNTSGGVVKIGGCINGSFTVTAINNGDRAGGNKIRIFNLLTTGVLTAGDSVFSINASPLPSGRVVASGAIGGTLERTNTTGNNTRSYNITLRSALNNISPSQADGNYSGAYEFLACGCANSNNNNACAADSSANRCSQSGSAQGVLFSRSVPSRISTPLSFETAQAGGGIPYRFNLPSSVRISCDTLTTCNTPANDMSSALEFSAGLGSRTLDSS
ncbi:MAG: hypothetical protein ACJAZX_001616, partial [Rickettsiales bacterium]